MQLEFIPQSEWPPLAWLAQCSKASFTVTIRHGTRVETGPDRYCEAVWAGDYDAGGFDQTDIVAGSGGRLRENRLTFVSSGSTIDRLQFLRVGQEVLVSNSLACLMAVADASVDAAYASHYDDAFSIVQGLDSYKRSLATSAGNVELIYFDNLIWDGMGLRTEQKPGLGRDFSSFEKYHEFLETSMNRIAENMAASGRSHPYSMLSTLSSGYDSTAVSVLARRFGCTEAITFDQARGGDEDSGESIAQHLSMCIVTLPREAWRTAEFAEVPFLASCSSTDDVIFKGAEQHLAGRVLMTGYHGDKVWDKYTKNLSPSIVRGDLSGLSLSEYRLWTGFINCPVPFWGARQIQDINTLSRSEEMRPWDVPGNYSRPICRRIGEEAGIPRHLFGIRKRAVSVNLYAGWDFKRCGNAFLTASSLNDYLDWIRQQRMEWIKGGRLPPIPSPGLQSALTHLHMALTDCNNWLARQPVLWRMSKYNWYRPQYLSLYTFPWALERAKQRYSRSDQVYSPSCFDGAQDSKSDEQPNPLASLRKRLQKEYGFTEREPSPTKRSQVRFIPRPKEPTEPPTE